jgi:hypothetical protein
MAPVTVTLLGLLAGNAEVHLNGDRSHTFHARRWRTAGTTTGGPLGADQNYLRSMVSMTRTSRKPVNFGFLDHLPRAASR